MPTTSSFEADFFEHAALHTSADKINPKLKKRFIGRVYPRAIREYQAFIHSA
jgi:hypothetical protein